MPIARKDVAHVAELARLSLDESEIDALTEDLGAIVEYVTELAAIDTTGVPPTAHVSLDRMPMRPDEVRPGLAPDAALAEAPRSASGGFAVPAFVDEG